MNFEYLLITNVYFGGIHTFSETGLTGYSFYFI